MTRIVALAACVFVAGCTLEDGSAPAVTGPSEFALSVTLTATPDSLPRDGTSQAVVTVTVRDASGRPVSGQRLTIGSSMGTVSESSVTTGSNGQASFTVTAPATSSIGSAVIVSAVPIGSDGANAATRTLTILLTGASNRTAPTPSFSFTPTSPQANQAVRFDASATTDEGATCLDACTYSWNFGDGTTGSGRIVTKTFSAARTYTVSLTVTDAAGSSASTAQAVTVANVAAPTVTLAVAPNPPLEDHPATFTATATPASGHSIVSYSWTFGNGTTQTTTGPTVTKTYDNRGTFVASVTVSDELGQTASASLQFTISRSGASFTFSPSNPVTNDTVRFDASASTAPAGATITKYEWDFGDGTTDDKTDSIITHRYTAARKYVVRLTVTYSTGGTGTTTAEVTIAAPA